jgi:hypothetical protein
VPAVRAGHTPGLTRVVGFAWPAVMCWNPHWIHRFNLTLGNIMKKFLSLLAIALSLSMGAAQAEDAAKTPQQNKMASCNKDAGDKKGDERKAFMKDCLSAKPAAAPDKKTAQQEKMKTCNEQAKDKKGDERKKFMSECLKNK